jgi:membrane protein implicated in regulation of membrane protease activity
MFFAENKLLIAVTLAGAVVVGVILSLALGSWIFVVLAVLVHALATSVVVAMTMRMTGEQDKPDPRTVARLEEEGVADPERELNEAERSARQQG